MRKQAYLFLKRSMDIFGALFGLIFLSPLFLAVALLVRHKLGSPVIFRQERAGKGGKPFVIYKFRTMTDERDKDGSLLPDEKRLTPFGAFLRSTSIDELPELWNVLKGEMSLVGPRPLFVEYLPYYTKRESRRHDVRPGITGLAQVNGRNLISWDERLEMDVKYLENQSICQDIYIMLLTLWKVFLRKDIETVPRRVGEKLTKTRRTQGGSMNDFPMTFRFLEKKDLLKRVEIFNSSTVFETMGFREKLTIEKTTKWFSSKNDKERVDLVFYEKQENIIGMGGLVNINPYDQNAELYIAVSPEQQGKGWGKRIISEICKYGFAELDLNRIYLFNFVNNTIASRLYKSAGFKHEGLMRKHVFKSGVFQDRAIWGLLKEEWLLNRGELS